ncbi:MAG: hypothetical protein HYZ49_01105 [Chloroflexi bacterium]|nr:hypothetical protein [Chloroflexota bacterium]
MPSKKGRIQDLSVILKDESIIRSIFALIFVAVFAFFLLGSLILGGISLFMPLEGKVGEAKEIIVTISGIFSGPLGLILGYYFRSQVEKPST